MDYSKVEVCKPWGKEFPIYQTPECEVWLLKINKDERTSMHNHPNKKTALAVVGGCVKVHMVNSSFSLLPSEKINIRPGVFHQTECWSAQGALVVEMEVPPDKSNLVRMRDKYGRVGKGYETDIVSRDDFSENLEMSKKTLIGECELEIWDSDLISLEQLDTYRSLFILDGELKCGDFPVIGPGDATDPKVLTQLSEEFGPRPLKLLGIKRAN